MSSGTSTRTLPRSSGDLAKAKASGTCICLSAPPPTTTYTQTQASGHTELPGALPICSFPSPRTLLKLFPHLECLSPSLYVLILYVLAGTATLNCVLSLALFLFIRNKEELDLLIFQVSSKA